MKEVVIDFDFSKFGQEDITCKSGGLYIHTLHEHPHNKDHYYGIAANGSEFRTHVNFITMYQEMKPREIWINEQENAGFHYSKVFSSKAEAEAQKLPFVTRTLKFVEAIE